VAHTCSEHTIFDVTVCSHQTGVAGRVVLDSRVVRQMQALPTAALSGGLGDFADSMFSQISRVVNITVRASARLPSPAMLPANFSE